MSTTQNLRTGTRTDCPPQEQLDRLIHGRLSDAESSRLTEHIDTCCHCQERMDEIATAGNPVFSDAVKQLTQNDPPPDSAYWQAINRVRSELTGNYSATQTAGHASTATEHIKLDFLSASDKPGRLGRLGRFEIQRVLGRGGMGLVLHGFDDNLHRDVAVKVLDPQLASNDMARQRFCREARAAAAVSHENLVAVYEVGEDEKSGLPFMVMQLIHGESLEQRLRRVGRLSPQDVIKIGAQTAAGLASAHASKLIHRDIKPGNILLESGTDKVKLTDFGLARAAEDLKLTRTGFVAGTPLYMAPEQARGDDIDARADLFSLGSVLYEALAGQPPFDGKTPLAVLRRVADDQHVPLSKLNPEVPAWLEDVIDQLLEKDPAHRIQTAMELADLLSAHVTMPSAEITEPGCLLSSRSSVSRRRRKLFCGRQLAALAGLWLFGAIVGGYLVYLRDSGFDAKQSLKAESTPIMEIPAGTGAGPVMSVAISPDGDTLATGAESGMVSLWSIHPSHRKLIGTLVDHKGPVWAVEFTPDGKQLVSAGDDGNVKVWDIQTRKLIYSVPVGPPVRSAALNPTGNLIAVGNRQGDVDIFDLNQQAGIGHYSQKGSVNAVAFSPDGLTLASASSDSTVMLWELAGGRPKFNLVGHPGPVYGLSFSGDGQRVASAGWDPKVIIWDVTTGQMVRSIDSHDEGVESLQFSSCGRYLATGGQDGTAKLWDIDTGEALGTFTGHRGPVLSVDFGRHGSILATGGRDGTVKLWDTTPYMQCDLQHAKDKK